VKSILKKTGVLYGGEGVEREVSLRSGEEVIKGLGEAGFEVIPFELQRPSQLLEISASGRVDIFFITLHGSWGENGQVQSFLDLFRIPYTGPGFEACSLSMDKWVSKSLFKTAGIPVPEGMLLFRDPATEEILLPPETPLSSDRIVIKPASSGSTVGVSILQKGQDLADPVRHAARFSQNVLLEEYIEGRELAVTVIEQSGCIEVLPVVEIVPEGGFYTYDAKYKCGKSRYLVPAPLGAEELEAVKKVASEAFLALGCRIYARVDIRLDTNGVPRVLEVNTVPGMTSTSLVPKAAGAAGYEFPDFLKFLVEESFSLRNL
jgi:D-alanine-D-alanine ligase